MTFRELGGLRDSAFPSPPLWETSKPQQNLWSLIFCALCVFVVFIANDGFIQKTAEEILARGDADAVAFGRPFIANPDLPCRFALGAQLNAPDPKTFYAALRDVGYTDYPTLRTIGG
ncbi:MAG: hypothetical protein JOZ08_02310 [Verrucomicrobia bacterium]|nr:hypothetical protein [Verrucomicrobiota bacterium]